MTWVETLKILLMLLILFVIPSIQLLSALRQKDRPVERNFAIVTLVCSCVLLALAFYGKQSIHGIDVRPGEVPDGA